MGASLTFLGANGTVTGSRYLLESGAHRVLVDCGLFQGYKNLRLRNWARPPFDPAEIDAVVLTHAHLDHSGYLPRLSRMGFNGPVFATRGTSQLCGILLPDAGRLQEEDARFANKHGYSRHRPALPLYTEEDAVRVLRQFRTVELDHDFEPAPTISCRMRYAGHLLGAASVLARAVGKASVLFSGDLGRPNDAIMRPPHVPDEADFVVVESTYGDRRHDDTPPGEWLARVIGRVAARGGVVVIPTFAVGRAQALLLHLSRLRDAGSIPRVPVFLDSPMAIDATELYLRYHGEHRLDVAECRRLHGFATLVRTTDESRALLRRSGPMIVLAASGMATGGRVLHHLKAYAPHERNAIVLSGYQAGGTRGAAIARGDASIRIHGQDIPIRAEVHQLESISAHADAGEILAWLRLSPRAPRQAFVTHGEPDAAEALRVRLGHELGWSASVPEFRDRIEL